MASTSTTANRAQTTNANAGFADTRTKAQHDHHHRSSPTENKKVKASNITVEPINLEELHAAKDVDPSKPMQLDPISPTPKSKADTAAGRLKGAVSGGLKWIAHKGMWGGGIAAIAGYMILGKILAIPGLLVAIPSAIIYFSQPSSSKQSKVNHQDFISKLQELKKEPHKLENRSSSELFEEISKQANTLSPEQKDEILAELIDINETKFLAPHEYPDQKSRENAAIVKASLERAIAELSPRA